jgi:hypothetical protein
MSDAGFYVYNDGTFVTPEGRIVVPEKHCVEIAATGFEPGEVITIYESFGPSCDDLQVPATTCCSKLQLSADCPKVMLCDAGQYWVAATGVAPDDLDGQDPADFPANLKVYAVEMDIPPASSGCGGGCG